jgi:thymidylate synthase (FAD)
MIEHCTKGFELYNQFIDEGVAPEHARIILGLNTYTHWLWNQDLHNMMHFLSLRDHSHAQIEAQKYAQAITTLLRAVLPRTMDLYDKYRRRA